MDIISARFSGPRQSSDYRFCFAPTGAEGNIRRVIRGIYDYPRFSKMLDQHSSAPTLTKSLGALGTKISLAHSAQWSHRAGFFGALDSGPRTCRLSFGWSRPSLPSGQHSASF
jgi:hypothetical protein